jgi:hypothetical protein
VQCGWSAPAGAAAFSSAAFEPFDPFPHTIGCSAVRLWCIGRNPRLYPRGTLEPLAEAAAKVLREPGYDNVSVKVGDGYLG